MSALFQTGWDFSDGRPGHARILAQERTDLPVSSSGPGIVAILGRRRTVAMRVVAMGRRGSAHGFNWRSGRRRGRPGTRHRQRGACARIRPLPALPSWSTDHHDPNSMRGRHLVLPPPRRAPTTARCSSAIATGCPWHRREPASRPCSPQIADAPRMILQPGRGRKPETTNCQRVASGRIHGSMPMSTSGTAGTPRP